MSAAAVLAIKYATMRKTCGRYSAAVWYSKQDGFNAHLGRLAVQLMAAQSI